MRFKLFTATALAGTLVLGTAAAAAAAQPADHHLSSAAGAQAARVAPGDTIAMLGDLGGVTQAVNGLVQAGAPAKGAPDAAAVKDKQADLQAALDELKKKAGEKGGVLAARKAPPLSVEDAIAKLKKSADALTSKATAEKPDKDAILEAVKSLAADELALVTALTTKLGGGNLPTQNVPATG